MNFQPSEIADLLMMLVLGPIVLVAVRRTLPALFWPSALCLGLMASGYVATVAEGVAYPDFFNLVEHVSYGIAGFAFVGLLVACSRLLGSPKAGR